VAPIPVTFSDTEGRFCCLKLFGLPYLWKYDVLTVVRFWKAYVICNFTLEMVNGAR